jgi:hypothetical protein
MQEEECRKLRYKTSLSTGLEIEDIHWPKREKKGSCTLDRKVGFVPMPLVYLKFDQRWTGSFF